MAAGPFAQFTAALCLKNAPVFAAYFGTATALYHVSNNYAPFYRGVPATISPEWQAATTEMNVNPVTSYIRQQEASSVTVRTRIPIDQTLKQ